MSAAGASAPPPSPPGGQDGDKPTDYNVPAKVIPLSGNGTTKTYVVDGLGLSPRYIRTTLVDARSWAETYTILDGDTYQVVTQLPAGPMANPSMTTAGATAQQMSNVVAHENAVASGGGPVAHAYHALQAHRK